MKRVFSIIFTLFILVVIFGCKKSGKTITYKIPTTRGELVTLKAGNSKIVFDNPKFKNKVLIVDFWATWCSPCIREIPHFIELDEKYKDKGLEIIGIAMDAYGEEIVRPFVEDFGFEYTTLVGVPGMPQGMDTYPYIPIDMASLDIETAFGYMIRAYPTTFFVDREGNIREMFEGYHSLSALEEVVEKLLNE